MSLTVIIPAFNEEKTISSIINKINQVMKTHIIVVDDGSTDKTASKVKKLNLSNVTLIQHQHNMGKGKAIHTALSKVHSDFILIQDADLEYNPEEYPQLLQPLQDDVADVVYGSRFSGGKPRRVLFFWHTIGNRMLTFLSNLFTNLNLTDMETGYKAFRTNIIKDIYLEEKSFGFEPEITAKIAKIKKLRIYEVGISYNGRTYQEGKKINWRDGFRAVYCIFKYNLFSSSQKQFTYKENDQEGEQALDFISEADNLNRWHFQAIQPFVSGNILEIGSGIGNISEQLVEHGYTVTLSDIRKHYCQALKQKFRDIDQVKEVLQLDIIDPQFDTKYQKYFNSFDAIYSLNVFEHIKNDTLAIKNTNKLLKKKGALVLLVPAIPTLYNNLDKNLYHYRRYAKTELQQKLVNNNFAIQKTFYMNFANVFGWFLVGTVLKRKQFTQLQVKLYNVFVPIFKLADKLVGNRWGLSLVCVVTKKS